MGGAVEELGDPYLLTEVDWVFSGPLTPRGQECPVGFKREKSASYRYLMFRLASVVFCHVN